ncbi:MAG TPA: hypothetical protein VFH98_05095 [Candidatus Limnocylindria bacterium]|nr:hypothetical protein [Candidatus Limnocylindria bacterium]
MTPAHSFFDDSGTAPHVANFDGPDMTAITYAGNVEVGADWTPGD